MTSHLKTVIHPAGPVVSAILALSELRRTPQDGMPAGPVSGQDFVNALVLGVEVECRIGNAVYPGALRSRLAHHRRPRACSAPRPPAGKLLGLSEQQMVWALGPRGDAAGRPARDVRLHDEEFPPRTRGAERADSRPCSPPATSRARTRALEGKSGWARVLSTTQDYRQITDGLGKTYELSLNTYKPFACGIVIHPAIDACIQLRNEHALKPEQIERIDLRVHAAGAGADGQEDAGDRTGIQVQRLLRRGDRHRAGRRRHARLQRRERAKSRRDRRCAIACGPTSIRRSKKTQVRATITLKDGRTLDKFVEHAVGSLERPMSDRDLEAKFSGLADGVLPAPTIRALIDLCWKVGTLPDVAALATAARPA